MHFTDLIRRTRLAYVRTFCGDDGRPTPAAEAVLADLRQFCGVDKPGLVVSPITRQVDPLATAARAALRDVYFRVSGFISLEKQLADQERRHARADTATE